MLVVFFYLKGLSIESFQEDNFSTNNFTSLSLNDWAKGFNTVERIESTPGLLPIN